MRDKTLIHKQQIFAFDRGRDAHVPSKIPRLWDYLEFRLPGLPLDEAFPECKNVFYVAGRPTPWARPFNAADGRRRFDSQVQLKNLLRIDLKSQGAQILEGALVMFCEFAYVPSTSLTVKNRQKLLTELHESRPDLDNLVKFVKDCGTGTMYKDDSQVALVSACKMYRDYEGTTIWLYRAKELRGLAERVARQPRHSGEAEDDGDAGP